MILVIVCLQMASAERVEVVTPENHLPHGVVKEEGNVTEADDTYLRAYREVHNIADRRNPLSSYGDQSYNTLTHSSYIDDDVYPEFSYKAHSYKHRYPPHPAVVYGPPSPVNYYHHHHHTEPVNHHTIVGLPVVQPFHVISSYMNKFGLHKVLTLIAKIVVLKIILKFVMVVALFFFLPAVLPREKEKDDTSEDRLLSSLNDITDRVWNSITENENMMEEEEEEEEEDQGSGQDSNEHENHKNNDLDEVDLKLINKLIREWKEEHFGGPE